MVTMVGLEKNFTDALKDLIELEYDAVEAYKAAIERLESKQYKDKMSEFLRDHERHIQEFSNILKKHNEEAPQGPDMSKHWLAEGKVVLAGLIGDQAILTAMKTNEDDTNTAYERLNQFSDMWQDSENFLKEALKDERRHRAWIESEIS
ncbi:MAG: PA2169 family four-helix-bundle protein [Candidatus Paracaedibacteraceae bacterium]|nr:PA2169 family four-helix-bundle protein [Candidatus Paracaedibacteraceae bacterium]